MVSPDQKTFEITGAFTKYLELKDESLIQGFNLEEIEIVLLQRINDGDSPYYVAMQIRREELRKLEHQKREKRIKWKNRITILIVGSVLGFLLLFLKLIYFP